MPDKVRPLQAESAVTQEMPVDWTFPTTQFLNEPGTSDAHEPGNAAAAATGNVRPLTRWHYARLMPRTYSACLMVSA